MPDTAPTATPPAPWLLANDPVIDGAPGEHGQECWRLPDFEATVHYWPRGTSGASGPSVVVCCDPREHAHLVTLFRWLSERGPDNQPAAFVRGAAWLGMFPTFDHETGTEPQRPLDHAAIIAAPPAMDIGAIAIDTPTMAPHQGIDSSEAWREADLAAAEAHADWTARETGS